MQTPKTHTWLKISEVVFIATLIFAGPFHLGFGLTVMSEPLENPTVLQQQREAQIFQALSTGCVVSWPCILAAGIWHERLRSQWKSNPAENAPLG